MIKIYDSKFYDLLPPNLKNFNTKALSYALDKQNKKLLDYTNIIYLYCAVKILPENMLDIISDNFKIAGYDKTLEVETKRELLLSAFYKYSTLGTAGAVESLVSTIFGNAKVSEWFNYGGDPYFFRISLENENLSDIDLTKFIQVLNQTKNVRSWLEYLLIIDSYDLNIYSGLVYNDVTDTTYPTDLQQNQDSHYEKEIFIGAGYINATTTTYKVKE